MTEKNERGERVASPLRNIVSAIAPANKRTFLESDTGRFDDRNIEKKKKPKKKKNQEKPNWDEMEIFADSNPTPSLEEVVREVTRRIMDQMCGGGKNFPPRRRREKQTKAPLPVLRPKRSLSRRKGPRKRANAERRRRRGRKGGRRRGDASARQPPLSAPKGEHSRKGRSRDQIHGQDRPLHTRSLPFLPLPHCPTARKDHTVVPGGGEEGEKGKAADRTQSGHSRLHRRRRTSEQRPGDDDDDRKANRRCSQDVPDLVPGGRKGRHDAARLGTNQSARVGDQRDEAEKSRDRRPSARDPRLGEA